MRLRRAFTLIELLVVISILAILAALIIPHFMRPSSTTTQVNPQSTPAPQVERPAPVTPTTYQVDTVALTSRVGYLSTLVHETLVTWLRAHPDRKVVDVISSGDGYIVILSETR